MLEQLRQDTITEILEKFTSLNSTIDSIISITSNTPQGFSSSIYSTMQGIAEAIIPIAIVIAVLFFIIELCNKSVMMEIVSWENAAKLLLKLVLAKVMIQSSFWLLETIFGAIIDLMNVVGTVSLTIPAFNEEIVRSQIGGMDLFPLLGFKMSIAPLTLILTGITWIVQLIVYGRMIELYVMFAVSPLPIATLAGEGVHDIAKKFFQHFIAVSLQGVVILIAVGVFAGFIGMITGIGGDSGSMSITALLSEYILMTMVLALTLFKSGSWAKQIVGLM